MNSESKVYSKLKIIKQNELNKLIKIEELNLKNNLIETIEQYSFYSNILLKSLDLSNNKIFKIEANYFNGLNSLWSLNLLNNSLVIIDKLGFNNTHCKKIFISLSNISVENMLNLKQSLKSILVKKYLNYEYYDSTYIENRIDIKCEKTFSLIKSKIFYNFLFEYDMINFLNDCKYNSQFKLFNQLMNDSFYLHQNASNLHYIHIKTYEIYVLIIFTAILIGLTYIFIRCWFKKDVKANNGPSNMNNIELIAVNESNLDEITIPVKLAEQVTNFEEISKANSPNLNIIESVTQEIN